MERVVLVDAYGHIYRSFFGLRSLTDAQGRPANAVYALARFLLHLDESLPSRYGAVAYDMGKCTRRCALLPAYKAQRPPMPDDLRGQLGLIREFFVAFGWPLLQEEGREADDLLAAVANRAEDCQVDILSFDKDLSQLVKPTVQIVSPGRNGAWDRLDEEGVKSKFGVLPGQICDYLALLGDSSDNIGGVEGIGPKTAARLLQEHGDMAGILAALPTMPSGSLRSHLEEAAASGLRERNRRLVALDDSEPQDWQGLPVRRSPDWPRIRGIAAELGFKSIVAAVDKKAPKAPEQLMLF